jgi:hypothetical protein
MGFLVTAVLRSHTAAPGVSSEMHVNRSDADHAAGTVQSVTRSSFPALLAVAAVTAFATATAAVSASSGRRR